MDIAGKRKRKDAMELANAAAIRIQVKMTNKFLILI